ncbi:ECU07_1775 [Encephalitozoon cuniculi GB-M1]|uniref:ECU07_1775 protein n=1 Tax=Encephalitozoon cuniculi (strain GB-M1) TaxID=284813 RepID=A0A1T5PD66_ENCCU|nr:uncharacterized protein ECU07_1775 [Encephalitozoon cuniculi GB-M1]SKD10691.1 ECU07_1775 [Encephalitozoon cuniculi GB-M1]
MRVLLVILMLATAVVLIVTMTVILENINRKPKNRFPDSSDDSSGGLGKGTGSGDSWNYSPDSSTSLTDLEDGMQK